MKLGHAPHDFIEGKVFAPGSTGAFLSIFTAIGNKAVFLFCLKLSNQSFKMPVVIKIHFSYDFCKHIQGFFCTLCQSLTDKANPVAANKVVVLVTFSLCQTSRSIIYHSTEGTAPDISHHAGGFRSTAVPALTIPAQVCNYIC